MENKEMFTVKINGKECESINDFFDKISSAFMFPDYFGNNMESLSECLNDLSWLSNEEYCLVITHINIFLSKESIGKKQQILDLLEDVKKEWANVPNFEGEDEYRKKTKFKIMLC